jgi:histidine triad (HIT) family protein
MSASNPSAPCVFCGIAAGEVEASVVCGDERTLAFMDLRQSRGGHVLIVPKTHMATIFELDDATGAAVMATVVQVARAVRAVLSPDGVNISQSNGEAAGQEVFHLHFHVQPRWHGDGLLQYYPGKPDYPARAELDRQAEQIAKAMRSGAP